MSKEISLKGLEAPNALGFLAALGVMTAINDNTTKLSWDISTKILPTAVISTSLSKEMLIDKIVQDKTTASKWKILTSYEDVSLFPDDAKSFLVEGNCEERRQSSSLVQDINIIERKENKKYGKTVFPPLHFIGNNGPNLLANAAIIGQHCSDADIENALFGPWHYETRTYLPPEKKNSRKEGNKKIIPTFKWDFIYDRQHALSAYKPGTGGNDIQSVIGADWLAFRGLSMFPIFGSQKRVMMSGYPHDTDEGYMSWVIWDKFLGIDEIRTVLQSIPEINSRQSPTRQELRDGRFFPQKGLVCLYTSKIARATNARYGTISASSDFWL